MGEEDPGHVEVFIAGENVVCGGGGCGGEGTGQATIDIDPEAGTLCYDLDLEDLPEPTAAHLHRGPLGAAGPVVLDLGWEGDERGGSRCLEDLDPGLLRTIVDDKRAHYLQVHSEAYPEGAARGHLST